MFDMGCIVRSLETLSEEGCDGCDRFIHPTIPLRVKVLKAPVQGVEYGLDSQDLKGLVREASPCKDQTSGVSGCQGGHPYDGGSLHAPGACFP